jgi:diguanylate cyclase (GGDEF)-like protein
VVHTTNEQWLFLCQDYLLVAPGNYTQAWDKNKEFVILMPHTDQEDELASAERVRATVAQTIFQAEGEHIRLTISMGVASYCNDHTPNIDAMLKRADKALYQAKHAGRN